MVQSGALSVSYLGHYQSGFLKYWAYLKNVSGRWLQTVTNIKSIKQTKYYTHPILKGEVKEKKNTSEFQEMKSDDKTRFTFQRIELHLLGDL